MLIKQLRILSIEVAATADRKLKINPRMVHIWRACILASFVSIVCDVNDVFGYYYVFWIRK